MLSLDQRRLFLNALKPPPGYEFDRGVGTTFTLDLTALLVAPLSLSLLDGLDSLKSLDDPVLLLEGLRRSAEKITIFCQAGRIGVPKRFNYLYRFLENRVVEVQAPFGGVFHPKIWLLRYVAEDSPVIYRFLCLSRNLTFDKSWDLMLQLEGDLVDRKVAYGRNNPLGDFIQALPTLANSNDVQEEILESITLLQDEVRRVDFHSPEDFGEDISFHPLGIHGYRRGFLLDKDYHRTLVVSPFLQDKILKRISSWGNDHVLISELESLDKLDPKTKATFSQIFTVDTSIWDGDREKEGSQLDIDEKSTTPDGLHAKLFVLDQGWDSTWLMGSANATKPGLSGLDGRNVEFMVELRGKRSQIGIDRVLGDEDNDTSLRNMLRTYKLIDDSEPVDQDALKAERLAEDVRNWLIASKFKMTANKDSQDSYELIADAMAKSKGLSGQFSINCWPLSLPDEHKKGLDVRTQHVRFSGLSLLALTPFLAFEVIAQVAGSKHRISFVLQLPVAGFPESRDDYLISAIISDKSQFLRYLHLILAEDPYQVLYSDGWENILGQTSDLNRSSIDGMPLLEELIRAFSRAPEKIDRIDKIVERLKRTPEGQQVLPKGFEELWSLILKARLEKQ